MAVNERAIEARGDDVEAAIESGLQSLGLSRDQVSIEVLEQGSRGFLGIGSREAVVRLTTKAAPAAAVPPVSSVETVTAAPVAEEPVAVEPTATAGLASAVRESAHPRLEEREDEEEEGEYAATSEADYERESEAALEVIGALLTKMKVRATASVHLSESDDMTGSRVPIVEISGDDLGTLIGPHGETLNAFQYLSRLMVGHMIRRRPSFVIDVGGYRQRREQALARLADRMAQKVVQQGRPLSLEPMAPHERRIIHMTLRNHERVYTQSVGEGEQRKVRILLKR
jgi:spoIIIJ-associated protein